MSLQDDKEDIWCLKYRRKIKWVDHGKDGTIKCVVWWKVGGKMVWSREDITGQEKMEEKIKTKPCLGSDLIPQSDTERLKDFELSK